jgi:lysosomal alpha-mannosidase
VDSLLLNPERTFIQVEQAFFMRAWNDMPEKRRQQVKKLVENGQLHFVHMGHCMEDDAAPTLNAVVEQMTLGHEFLLETFGVRPRVAYHIDPFGLSSSLAALWNMSGFEYFVINRIDYRQKNAWFDSQGLEFMWQGSPSLGQTNSILTHVLDHHYSSPMGFSFEWGFYGDGPAIISKDTSEITPSNLQSRADLLWFEAVSRSQLFVTPHLLLLFGDDFVYQNAGMIYSQIEKLMEYINGHPERYNGTTMRYSTLADYFDTVQEWISKNKVEWPVYNGDFFPYADNAASYWTGYFSSRLNVKRASRQAESFLKNTEAIAALSLITKKNSLPLSVIMSNITLLREGQAIVQHHDGVAGTEQQHVAVDYLQRLVDGTTASEPIAASSIRQVLLRAPHDSGAQNAADFSLEFDTACAGIPSGGLVPVVLTNSLGYTRFVPVEIPLPVSLAAVQAFSVIDASLESLPSQVTVLPDGSRTLSFLGKVPANGVSTFFVQRNSSSTISSVNARLYTTPAGMQLKNDYLTIDLDAFGLPAKISNPTQNLTQLLAIELLNYNSSEDSSQPSGAYIFRPATTGTDSLCRGGHPESVLLTGPLFDLLIVDFSKCSATPANLTVRLWKGLPYRDGARAETSTAVGPLDVSSGGRESIARFSTGIQNQGVFFTDDNGYEVLSRTRNLKGRPGDVDAGVALAGNFYPAVTRVSIQDGRNGFSVLSECTHGASSIIDGSVELMVARRLRKDDYRGVTEPLDDTNVVVQKLWLLLEQPSGLPRAEHHNVQELNYPVQIWFGAFTKGSILSVDQWSEHMETIVAPIIDLPESLHLLTFKIRSASKPELVVRLYHQFAVGDHATLSEPVTVDLLEMLSPLGLKIGRIDQVSLTLNKIIQADAPSTVTLGPKQIVSFVIAVNP